LVRVFVDPYNDKKSGYFFAVNAGGTMSMEFYLTIAGMIGLG
jgi:hypothetical protein